MIEMPSDMKGLEKSITSSRTNVIVNGATAISAFCGDLDEKEFDQPPERATLNSNDDR